MKSHAVLFALLLAGACTPAASADPRSAPSADVRKTGIFRGIEITGTIGVDAKVGPAASVEVRGEADRLVQVTTDVKNGVLVIGTKGELKDSHLRVIVTVPDLTAITISGTGELNASGISNAKLEVQIPGTGSVALSGTTENLTLSINGTGSVEAKQLVASSATIQIKGTGDVVAKATRAVDASVSGTGAIQVFGNPPSVKKSVTGTASIDVR